MTTAVASPNSFQSIPRIGWNNGNGNSMSADEVSRMFMPQRKSVQRTNSSSSIASSSSSTSTISSSQTPTSNASINGESGQWQSKKKPRGGFWPSPKAEAVSGVTNTRPQVSTSSSGPTASAAMSAVHQPSPVVPSQHLLQSQQNGARTSNGPPSNEPVAVLALLPLNGTFERKQISVPYFPDVLRVGRQTNAKTVPTPINGYFDSKVLSRQHAEVWAEKNGKIWIRDVKSSNGTFVNGQRLSPENRDSDPHELHEHDTLELGIDIVSEDQKTIVHHKVSAKVEYVGIPGSSNNVLDLNFGDMDTSQGGGLLSSPLNQPLAHSRGRVGGPMTNGRLSASSSVVGGQVNSLAQQRQMNFWSVPLNVEHLVKTLSAEMKAARQQSQDLDQAGNFLTSFLSNEIKDEKPQPSPGDNSFSRQLNGKPKIPKLDPVSRFSDPPAPPPQQPLPDKPDVARGSPLDSPSTSFIKRSDTARPGTEMSGSPTNPQSSQILSLVEALSSAKKELNSQGARVKYLEDMLKQERSARESAEERARRLEEQSSFRPNTEIEEAFDLSDSKHASNSKEVKIPWPEVNGAAGTVSTSSKLAEQELQQRIDLMVAKMDEMKQEMAKYQQRAETAENESSTHRTTLAEMITKFRERDADAAVSADYDIDGAVVPSPNGYVRPGRSRSPEDTSLSKQVSKTANGHIRAPSRLPESLEHAMATVLRESKGDGAILAQSAPYASMLGVVLLGVGLMAYLNSWQKVEK